MKLKQRGSLTLSDCGKARGSAILQGLCGARGLRRRTEKNFRPIKNWFRLVPIKSGSSITRRIK